MTIDTILGIVQAAALTAIAVCAIIISCKTSPSAPAKKARRPAIAQRAALHPAAGQLLWQTRTEHRAARPASAK